MFTNLYIYFFIRFSKLTIIRYAYIYNFIVKVNKKEKSIETIVVVIFVVLLKILSTTAFEKEILNHHQQYNFFMSLDLFIYNLKHYYLSKILSLIF